MLPFFSGMITMGFLTAAVFFLRFWRRTGDILFAVFGVAFTLFALNQALVGLADAPREEHTWYYLLRLAGFALLVIAIIGKNLGAARPPSPES
jgi:hypothetical protein